MSEFWQRIDSPILAANESDHVERKSSTGINVLIVGAGIGGLTTAIECYRNGHNVRVIERSDGLSVAGDMFTIGLSGRRFIDHYPSMAKQFDDLLVHNLNMAYRKWNGELIGDVFPFSQGAPGSEQRERTELPPMITQIRQLFHRMLFDQLRRFTIDVEFGKRVVRYYEDGERGVGGVITDQGEKFEADLVIAADGLSSRSQAIVPTPQVEAKPTGRTIFRTMIPLEIAMANPLVKENFGLRNDTEPFMQFWPGSDMYCVALSYVDKYGKNGKLCYAIAFRDAGEQESFQESWHHSISSEDVLRVVDKHGDCSAPLRALIEATPAGHIIAWPLKQRNPNPCWHSPEARVLQLGDAAHALLPNSGNGATQAIEDGVTIAACLRQAGRQAIPLAVRTHNLLRFDRVTCTQLLGYINAQRMQKADWAKVNNDASRIQPRAPKWVWSLDPEKYAYENWLTASSSLQGGPAFQNTNIPPGYIPKPWTIDSVEQDLAAGKGLEVSGDWS